MRLLLQQPRIQLDILNAEGETPLMTALSPRQKNINVVSLLLDKGARLDDPRSSQATPLMRAATNSSLEQVEMFLGYGASPRAQDADGWNALFWAVQSSRPCERVVLALVAHDTHCGVHRDTQGRTASYVAREFGHEALAALLDVEVAKKGDLAPRQSS